MPRVKTFNEAETLDKAMNLFWKQGYTATSVQDLVNHLGINRASLYDTFGDKEQLFKKSFALYRKISRDGLVQFLNDRPNVKNGFSELFKNTINEAIMDTESKGCFVVNTTTELIPNDDTLVDIIDNNRKDMETIFYEYLQKGKEDGQLQTSQDLKSIASLFHTLFNGIRVVAKVRPDKKELSDSIDLALSLLG